MPTSIRKASQTLTRLREVVKTTAGAANKKSPPRKQRRSAPSAKRGRSARPASTPVDRDTEAARVLRRLRELLTRQGMSFRQAAIALGKPRSTLHGLAQRHDIKHRPPNQLSAKKTRTLANLIDEATLSPRDIARKLKIHKATVARAFRRKLEVELPEATFRPRRVQARRCPEHGLVNVWPCVACAAVAAVSSVPNFASA